MSFQNFVNKYLSLCLIFSLTIFYSCAKRKGADKPLELNGRVITVINDPERDNKPTLSIDGGQVRDKEKNLPIVNPKLEDAIVIDKIPEDSLSDEKRDYLVIVGEDPNDESKDILYVVDAHTDNDSETKIIDAYPVSDSEDSGTISGVSRGSGVRGESEEEREKSKESILYGDADKIYEVIQKEDGTWESKEYSAFNDPVLNIVNTEGISGSANLTLTLTLTRLDHKEDITLFNSPNCVDPGSDSKVLISSNDTPSQEISSPIQMDAKILGEEDANEYSVRRRFLGVDKCSNTVSYTRFAYDSSPAISMNSLDPSGSIKILTVPRLSPLPGAETEDLLTYSYSYKKEGDASYTYVSTDPLTSYTDLSEEVIANLISGISYQVRSRVCLDEDCIDSLESNASRTMDAPAPIGRLISGNGTQNIVVDFERLFQGQTSYGLYSDQTCMSKLATFTSDASARAENISVSGLSDIKINYFWIKKEGDSRCRRTNFAYKMTDPCANLEGGDWVWVPPLSDDIGDGLGARAFQVGFTNPNGLCVTKYIVSIDQTCSNSIRPGFYGGVSTFYNNCAPISDSSKDPWVDINQTEANAACKRLGTNYRLLTNAERMTISLNAEADYRNWSNQIGFDGTAKLNRGHADAPNSGGYYGPRFADEGVCLTETTPCALDPITNWHQNRRTFYVKNGMQGNDVIWDLAGNVGTWSLWSESLANLGTAQMETGHNWEPPFVDSPPMTQATSLPQNVLNGNATSGGRAFNLGFYNRNNLLTTSSGVPLWGANWFTDAAGLFAFDISHDLSFSQIFTGFICSFQP